MLVQQITLSNYRESKKFDRDSFLYALALAAEGDSFSRIAFAGRTKLGKSGVALDLFKGKITGHKIDPIPPQMPDRVRHFPLRDTRKAFEAIANGEDVLIGTETEGLILRFAGPGIEIYGAGDDSF